MIALYLLVVKPWRMRWGATDDEVSREMPGDELIPGAASATRAITIEATPDAIWPWLVQLGYGKAGWYSYDWIDNDFRPSANRILPQYQSLSPSSTVENATEALARCGGCPASAFRLLVFSLDLDRTLGQ